MDRHLTLFLSSALCGFLGLLALSNDALALPSLASDNEYDYQQLLDDSPSSANAAMIRDAIYKRQAKTLYKGRPARKRADGSDQSDIYPPSEQLVYPATSMLLSGARHHNSGDSSQQTVGGLAYDRQTTNEQLESFCVAFMKSRRRWFEFQDDD
jgi:hypothetical protein